MSSFKNLFWIFYKFKEFLRTPLSKFFLFLFAIGFSSGTASAISRNLSLEMNTGNIDRAGNHVKNENKFFNDYIDNNHEYDYEENYFFLHDNKIKLTKTSDIKVLFLKAE